MRIQLSQLMRRYVDADLSCASGRAIVEERYWSLRRQVPVVYLLGLVNLSAMEIAATGAIAPGPNLPTFIGLCGLLRLGQWFGGGRIVTHTVMVRRMKQTVWFAGSVGLAVAARCLYLLHSGDLASDMAVLLFGGLTAIGVAYGLTALPAAGRIPLVLIILPISFSAAMSNEPHFSGAAFGLVVVAALTMRLLGSHSRHFTDVIMSRAGVLREQQLVEHAHREAVVAAATDFLTGLPNRRAFVAALETAAERPDREPAFTVAILDLDHFKTVNDTFGHAIGDMLLQEVASRLLAVIDGRGLVARLGGDEFGILLPELRRAKDVDAIGREILDGVNGPAFLDGRRVVISACCGLTISHAKDGKPPSRIMADADVALYQAKANPGRGMAMFELCMEAPRQRRADIERALQAPGVQDHLRIVFQPIFDLRTGRIIAHEALARWNDPELGAVPPSEFVPIAEHLNLIDDINKQLMELAFEKAREWPDEVKLSFNLSAIQICTPGAAKGVLRALKRSGLPARKLQVEVTETALLADFRRARENLDQLRAAGATIVLDDFGAGYASIGYLRQLRFDQIKLDGGLVTAAQHGADGKRLLQAVIGLCEILGVSTVAEHVESKNLLDLVMELGCSGGQGHWLKQPVPAEELGSVPPIGSSVVAFRRRRAA